MIKQIIQQKEEKILELYPYLSQIEIMSQEENENEAINKMKKIKDIIHRQLLNGKFNKISPQEETQEGMKFVSLINEIYTLFQQAKKILYEKNQSIKQLQQAEEQLKQERNDYTSRGTTNTNLKETKTNARKN